MYDMCAYVHVNRASMVLTQEDTLLKRSTKLRCQLLLATCAVFAQKLLHRSSYTSDYRQHIACTHYRKSSDKQLQRTLPWPCWLSFCCHLLGENSWTNRECLKVIKTLTVSQQALLNRTYNKHLKRKAYPFRMTLVFLKTLEWPSCP